MTAKEYFNQIAEYRDAIEGLKKHIETLHEGVTAIGGFDYAKPIVQSTPRNVTEDKIIEVADAALECSTYMARWSTLILEAEKRLTQMSRLEYSRVIRLRHLDGRRHSWGWIADELDYDEDYTRKIYTAALTEFEEKFLKSTQKDR